MNLRRLAIWYLVVQGCAAALWWVLLLANTAVRDWFFPEPAGWPAGRTLVFADIAMFSVLSIVAGALAWLNHRHAVVVGWMFVGSAVYATLVAAGWLLEPISHWLGLVLMVPSAMLTTVCIWTLHSSVAVEHKARP